MSSARFCSTLFLLSLVLTSEVRAYLGGFEEQDGYRIPGTGNIFTSGIPGDAQFYLGNNPSNGFTGIVPPGAFPNTLGDSSHGPDLSRYNAGQYGTNNGGPGGTATDIADNSGLWTALAGGRLNEDLGAPLYQGNLFARDYVQAYGYPSARSGSQVLNLLASDVNLRYNYSLDSRDLDGVVPAMNSGYSMDVRFWSCPSGDDDADTGDMVGIAFKDSAGQILVEVGYTGDNRVQYRVGGATAWTTTAIHIGTTGWSEFSLNLDSQQNTVSLGVTAYDDAQFILGNETSLLNAMPLGFDALNLTDITWDLRGGALDNDAFSFKHYFDDFDFALTAVPEPSAALLLMVSALLGWKRRRC